MYKQNCVGHVPCIFKDTHQFDLNWRPIGSGRLTGQGCKNGNCLFKNNQKNSQNFAVPCTI